MYDTYLSNIYVQIYLSYLFRTIYGCMWPAKSSKDQFTIRYTYFIVHFKNKKNICKSRCRPKIFIDTKITKKINCLYLLGILQYVLSTTGLLRAYNISLHYLLNITTLWAIKL